MKGFSTGTGSRIKRALTRRAPSGLARWLGLKPAEPIPDNLDILFGIRAVARFLGVSKAQARGLIAAGDLPTFRLGTVECARRTTLSRYILNMEARDGERS